MGRGTFGEVRDGSLDSRGGPELFVGLSGRFETGRWIRKEVRDGSGVPRRGPGRVVGPSGTSWMGSGILGVAGTGRGTLGQVWDGSEDTRGCSGRVEEV